MYSQLQPSNDKKELKYTKFSVFNIQFNDRVEDEGGESRLSGSKRE